MEELDSADCDLGTVVWEDMDCPVLIVDNSLCNSSQAMSNYGDVASMGDFADEDFIDTGFDSDMGSGAEFEWNTRHDTCAWESWSAYKNSPTDSARALPAVSLKDVAYYIIGMIVNVRKGTSVIAELTLRAVETDMQKETDIRCVY